MVDYVKLLSVAKRLINKNGRDIILKRGTRQPFDANKPWGPRTKNPSPGNEGKSLAVRGVFVPPNTVREFGITSLGEGTLMEDMIKVSQQIVIIAGIDEDMRVFSEIIDRGETWGIQGIQVLRPGEIQLLSFVGVRR